MPIRQGDLMLVRIGDAEDSSDNSPKPVTLTVGEESGHSHVIDAAWLRGDQAMVTKPTQLRVEGMPWRHDPIALEPGLYKFWIQQELTEDEEVVRVTD